MLFICFFLRLSKLLVEIRLVQMTPRILEDIESYGGSNSKLLHENGVI